MTTRLSNRTSPALLGATNPIDISPSRYVLSRTEVTGVPLTLTEMASPAQASSSRLLALPRRIAADGWNGKDAPLNLDARATAGWHQDLYH